MKLRSIALLALPAVLLSAGEVREEILLVVNGHVLSRRVFQQAVEQGTAALYRQFAGKELDEKLRDARKKTLQGLIDSFVMEDKATDLNITITDDYVRSYVEEIKKQNNFTTDADFEKALKGSLGITLPVYLVRTRQDVVKQEVLRKEVYSKIAIEEAELKVYYQDHRDEFRQASRFRIRELVLSKGGTPEEQAATQASQADIRAKLKKGANFEALVKEFSTVPSRSLGGDLGWLSKGVLRTNLEEAALALAPNQISEPLETDKDFYLIQLVESDMDNLKPFAEVETAIREKLQEPKAQNALETYLSGLRLRANIRYMVPEATILKG